MNKILNIKIRLFAIALMLCLMPVAHGDDGENGDVINDGNNTLRYLLSKSSLIVSGELLTDRKGWHTSYLTWYGTMDVKILDVLAGAPGLRPINDRITVDFAQPSYTIEAEPQFPKGSKCLLFLKQQPDGKGWSEADRWIGIQPYSGSMATCLRRMWWETQVAKVKVGMSRAQVEQTLLPPLPTGVHGQTMTGSAQSATYWVDKEWQVTIWYDYTGQSFPMAKSPTRRASGDSFNKVVTKPTLTRKILQEMPLAILDKSS